MKKFFLITFVVCSMTFAGFAQTHANGYYRSNGIYVQPHTRSSPNSTNHDNYSTQGNANPYTGERGSVAPDYSSGASNYGAGQVIQTGPRGGQYYINSKGRKVYVPKR